MKKIILVLVAIGIITAGFFFWNKNIKKTAKQIPITGKEWQAYSKQMYQIDRDMDDYVTDWQDSVANSIESKQTTQLSDSMYTSFQKTIDSYAQQASTSTPHITDTLLRKSIVEHSKILATTTATFIQLQHTIYTQNSFELAQADSIYNLLQNVFLDQQKWRDKVQSNYLFTLDTFRLQK